MPKRAIPIHSRQGEQAALLRVTKRHKSGHQLVIRARIILAAGEGKSNVAIAQELFVSVEMVRLTVLCKTLEVSESGYSAWRNREPSQHSREDARISAQIQGMLISASQVDGSPRIHALPQGARYPVFTQAGGTTHATIGIMCTGKEEEQGTHKKCLLCSFCSESLEPGPQRIQA